MGYNPAAMKMILFSLGWTLPFCVLLAACRSAGTVESRQADARPEVTLRATDPAQVRQVARELFLERGYSEMASPLLEELIFDRPAQPEVSTRALRVRLRLTSRGRDLWRLTGLPLGVDRWRTELESETLLQAGFAQIQDFLETIKRRVEDGSS
jgi:hypothetical protein